MAIEEITSPSNQRIKSAVALRDARERRETGLLMIDGQSTVQHAVAGHVELIDLFIASKPDESHRKTIAYWQSEAPKARMHLVSANAMAKLQYGDRNEDVVAVARQPSLAIETLEQRILDSHGLKGDEEHACFLVLDQMEKPGNLGAVIRTADAAGVKAVLLSDPVSETWNPNAIRSSLGAIFRIPLAVGSSRQVQSWLAHNEISVYSARVDAASDYTQTLFPSKVAIVVGNESMGLGAAWNNQETRPISIPMYGAVDSLNVSVSAAIILFEILRQHRAQVASD